MGKQKDGDTTGRLEMRFDEKLRYLAEIAARAKGISFREYLEWAVDKSFADVELRRLPKRFRPSMEEVGGKIVMIDYSEQDARDKEDQINYILERWKDGLWQDSPLRRIDALKAISHVVSMSDPEQNLEHLLSPEQHQIWDFLWRNDEFLKATTKGKALNYRYIEDNWANVCDRALKPSK